MDQKKFQPLLTGAAALLLLAGCAGNVTGELDDVDEDDAGNGSVMDETEDDLDPEDGTGSAMMDEDDGPATNIGVDAGANADVNGSIR